MTRIARYLITGIISALFVCAPLNAFAFRGEGPGDGPGCREPGIFRCIGSLDLSEKQRADMDDLQAETRAKIFPLREELQRLEIPEALFAHTLDAAAIKSLLDRKKSINADILEIRHEAMIAAAQLLTPEQRSSMLAKKNSAPGYGGRGRRSPAWADCPWW